MKYLVSITAIIATVVITTYPLVWGDDEYRFGEHSNHATTALLPTYKEECSSCHMAYPPELLPTRSWEKIMAGLEDHFGDNAELDAESQQLITDFLVKNSADQSNDYRSGRFSLSIASNNTPLRITETPYFKHEHDEIPNQMVSQNAEVTSFSQCQACHKNAESGSFDEHSVRIPGYGRWDD